MAKPVPTLSQESPTVVKPDWVRDILERCKEEARAEREENEKRRRENNARQLKQCHRFIKNLGLDYEPDGVNFHLDGFNFRYEPEVNVNWHQERLVALGKCDKCEDPNVGALAPSNDITCLRSFGAFLLNPKYRHKVCPRDEVNPFDAVTEPRASPSTEEKLIAALREFVSDYIQQEQP